METMSPWDDGSQGVRPRRADVVKAAVKAAIQVLAYSRINYRFGDLRRVKFVAKSSPIPDDGSDQGETQNDDYRRQNCDG